MPGDQVLLKGMAGALVIGNVALQQRVLAVARGLAADAQGIVVATHALAGAEDGQVLPIEQAQVLVVADQGAARRTVAAQQVAAEKGRAVINVEQAQQGWGQIGDMGKAVLDLIGRGARHAMAVARDHGQGTGGRQHRRRLRPQHRRNRQ